MTCTFPPDETLARQTRQYRGHVFRRRHLVGIQTSPVAVHAYTCTSISINTCLFVCVVVSPSLQRLPLDGHASTAQRGASSPATLIHNHHHRPPGPGPVADSPSPSSAPSLATLTRLQPSSSRIFVLFVFVSDVAAITCRIAQMALVGMDCEEWERNCFEMSSQRLAYA
jgi:hypothetical protein